MSVEERPFDVRWEQRDAGVVVVASGEIDLWSAPEVKAALAAHAPATSAVVLDLRGVTFMDSSGLGLIVEPTKRARKHGFRFAVAVGGASDVQRILELSGPDEGARRSSTTRTRSWPASRVTREASAAVGHPRRPAGRAARSAATCSPSTGRRRRSARRSSGRAASQTIVQVVLTSRFSMWMAWGPELTFFCNDAYRRDTLGKKYPWALGRPAREVWAEIWPDIGPRIETVMRTGEATWDEALLLFLERSGYAEETYHTFSYSPLADDDGADRRDAVRRQRGHRAGDRRAPAGDAARPRRRHLGDAAPRTRCSRPPRAQLAADAHDAAVRARLPLRRRRPTAAWRAATRDRARRTRPRAAVRGRSSGAARRSSSSTLDVRRPADRRVGRAAASRRSCCRSRSRARAASASSSPALNRYRPLDDDYRGFLGLVAGPDRGRRSPSARAYEAERRRAEALAELDRGQDRVLHQRQPRAADAADAAARPGRGRAGRRRRRRSPSRSASASSVINRNAQRLLKLVNTLLDFSRLESGQVEAALRAGRPRPLHGRAGEHVRVGGRAGGADARRSTARRCPQPVYVDREMWAKIVLNLLSNALKFTFEGGVTVRLRPSDGAARADGRRHRHRHRRRPSRPRLFERFHRVVGARSRTLRGLGHRARAGRRAGRAARRRARR